MARFYKIYIWKKAPFIRLFLALLSGILLEYYTQLSLIHIVSTGSILIAALFLFGFLPEAFRFKFRIFQGIIISLIILILGLFVSWQKDIQHSDFWYGNHYSDSSLLVVTIAEPPVEKEKSFKALARVESVLFNAASHPADGNILLYFAKDSEGINIHYGDQIIIEKKIQPIKNGGNPGEFDYVRYAAFHQLYHQCYLKKNDWKILKRGNTNPYSSLLFVIRKKVVKIIDEYIKGRDEASIAKALLIGYKVDLDRDLVQAYSNAGIVHLIAISGLHMGIIYGVLFWLFSTIPIINKSKSGKTIIILGCLWLFALLTGASPSVLRAAVMFSFIVAGKAINKQGSIYNSLAASAFLLLCYNPYLVWDVGFQLSYLAVLGIVIVQPVIVNWFYFENWFFQKIWQLTTVSIAAQLFTFPICLYYFHQFPLLFLLSNIIAIPLATLILCGSLFLIVISPLSIVAVYWGKVVFGLLWLLNQTVVIINAIPFSLWKGFSISPTETLLMYGIICSGIYALLYKNKAAITLAMSFLILLSAFTAIDKWMKYDQKKMIVYNVPSHKAIDFIGRNKFYFVGDTELQEDNMLRNFHLNPSRIFFMADHKANTQNGYFQHHNFYEVYGKKIVMIDTSSYLPMENKLNVDYIIISKSPQLKIKDIAQTFNCNYYIFDASNALWKIDKWKKECEELHLQSHSVYEQGAFVTDL